MLKMNCSSCGELLDSNKKGFIACPKCGAVNAPSPSAGFSDHHVTHLPNHGISVVHASPPSKKNKSKLVILGIALSLLIVSGAIRSVSRNSTKEPAQIKTQNIGVETPAASPQVKGQNKPAVPKKTAASSTAPQTTVPAEYTVNVLVLKYFPLAPNSQNIDINVTGDVGDSYTTIRQRTVDTTNNLRSAIEKGTKYLGYSNPNAQSSVSANIVDTKEYMQAVPIKPTHGIPTTPDYSYVLNTNNICDYVNNKAVKEVWLWAYQGPNKSNGYPSLAISESKMSGPSGDISNSYRYDDMPKCSHTYVVYTFNYGRGTAEAFHSWGHQIEAELSAVDNNIFRAAFEGPDHPQALHMNAKCGSVHNPPNARYEYDYANPAPQPSSCLDWQADGTGQLANIGCQAWGCQYVSDTNNPQLNWLEWFWQNMPGKDNPKKYNGKQLRNWWDVHANFDDVMAKSRYLVTP
jgi:hypothetical protein